MDPPLITRRPAGRAHPTPLLFVHGAWHGGWCWDEHMLGFFADAGYVAHAFDLRGHGDDPRPLRRRTSIGDYVEDLGAAVESLDSPPVLIGHSMGGLIVQRHLEGRRLPGAVLLASVPVRGVWGTSLRVARRHPVALLQANLTLRLRPLVSGERLTRSLFFGDDMAAEDVARHAARLGDEAYCAYLGMFRPARPARVLTPILVVAAERDGVFTLDEQRDTARAYGGEPVVVAGAAHDLMLDRRWEAAAGAILEWLSR